MMPFVIMELHGTKTFSESVLNIINWLLGLSFIEIFVKAQFLSFKNALYVYVILCLWMIAVVISLEHDK